MPSYIYTPHGLKNKETGEIEPFNRTAAPKLPLMVIPDIEPYQSIVNSKVENGQIAMPVVGGRTQRREEMARAADRGLIPWEPVTDRPRGLINKQWAEKRGLKVSEAAQEWAKNKRKSQAAKAAECVNPKF